MPTEENNVTPEGLKEKFFERVREVTRGNLTCFVWQPQTYLMRCATEFDHYPPAPRYPHQVHYYICNGVLPPGKMRKDCDTPLCCNSAHWHIDGSKI